MPASRKVGQIKHIGDSGYWFQQGPILIFNVGGTPFQICERTMELGIPAATRSGFYTNASDNHRWCRDKLIDVLEYNSIVRAGLQHPPKWTRPTVDGDGSFFLEIADCNRHYFEETVATLGMFAAAVERAMSRINNGG